MKSHDQFYSLAQIYDIAFDFKDIPSECLYLRSAFRSYTGRAPTSFLDLAAGPALHAIEMAKAGLKAGATDLSPAMVQYGLEKSLRAGVTITYDVSNITSFVTKDVYDFAGIFMDSTSYLLTNEDFCSHLSSVARALSSDGLYVLEMAHPRDVFSVGSSTTSSWEVERDGIWTSVAWSDPNDYFDPVTQISETTVALKYRIEGVEKEIVETAPQRCFTANEIKALVKAEGSFEIIDIIGSLKQGIPFSNDKSAWRMIPFLKKRQ